RFDGGVQGQQVGLFGNALDHFQDSADVLGAGIDRFDLLAGDIDGGGQGVHRFDGLLHDLAAFFGLLVGIARLVGGIGGVAGDFLGGGAQLVDRGGDAFG